MGDFIGEPALECSEGLGGGGDFHLEFGETGRSKEWHGQFLSAIGGRRASPGVWREGARPSL